MIRPKIGVRQSRLAQKRMFITIMRIFRKTYFIDVKYTIETILLQHDRFTKFYRPFLSVF